MQDDQTELVYTTMVYPRTVNHTSLNVE